MNNNLFVGGFPYETTEAELSALFKTCGTVVSAKILMDRATGRSRGLAFVVMSTEDEARAAIAKLNGASVGQRKIFVNEARPKEDRPGGPAPRPGFVERRSGKDRRGAGGGEDRRPPAGPGKEGSFERKKAWSDKKRWDKRPPSDGGKKWGDKPDSPGKKTWGGEKRKSFGDKKPWGGPPGARKWAGKQRRPDR